LILSDRSLTDSPMISIFLTTASCVLRSFQEIVIVQLFDVRADAMSTFNNILDEFLVARLDIDQGFPYVICDFFYTYIFRQAIGWQTKAHQLKTENLYKAIDKN